MSAMVVSDFEPGILATEDSEILMSNFMSSP
jgi:hypothetical protein